MKNNKISSKYSNKALTIKEKLKMSELGQLDNLDEIVDLVKTLNPTRNRDTPRKNKKSQSNFRLYSYLEQELLRVKKISDLFSQKLANNFRYVHSDQLITGQERVNNFFTSQIMNKTLDVNSNFNKNISTLWKKAWG